MSYSTCRHTLNVLKTSGVTKDKGKMPAPGTGKELGGGSKRGQWEVHTTDREPCKSSGTNGIEPMDLRESLGVMLGPLVGLLRV